jgi:membrane protein
MEACFPYQSSLSRIIGFKCLKYDNSRLGMTGESLMGEESKPSAPSASRQRGRFLLILLEALPRMFRHASSEWINDNAPRLSASLAFYTLLSLGPIILLVVAFADVFYGEQAVEDRLGSVIRGVIGFDVSRAVWELIGAGYKPRTGVITTLLGLATLAFGASSMFVELRDAMNTIWNVPLPLNRNKAFSTFRLISNHFYSFAIMLGVGFLLLIFMVLSAWITAMTITVPRAATFAILYVAITALFAALYKIVPDVTLKWKDVALAALFTSLMFMIGKQLMEVYFSNAGFGSTYSAAGSPIVVFLWVYYSAQLFFWGVEFSKVYAKTMGSQRDRPY